MKNAEDMLAQKNGIKPNDRESERKKNHVEILFDAKKNKQQQQQHKIAQNTHRLVQVEGEKRIIR